MFECWEKCEGFGLVWYGFWTNCISQSTKKSVESDKFFCGGVNGFLKKSVKRFFLVEQLTFEKKNSHLHLISFMHVSTLQLVFLSKLKKNYDSDKQWRIWFVMVWIWKFELSFKKISLPCIFFCGQWVLIKWISGYCHCAGTYL